MTRSLEKRPLLADSGRLGAVAGLAVLTSAFDPQRTWPFDTFAIHYEEGMNRSTWIVPALLSIALTSCSDSNTADQRHHRADAMPTSISARAVLSPSAQYGSQPIAIRIEGEYANFTKPCRSGASQFGPAPYPRKVVPFDDAQRIAIPAVMAGASPDCPLRLTSIQAQLFAPDGDALARGAAHFNAARGNQKLQCFNSVGGPGYCLQVRPESSTARQASMARLIGDLSIGWE